MARDVAEHVIVNSVRPKITNGIHGRILPTGSRVTLVWVGVVVMVMPY